VREEFKRVAEEHCPDTKATGKEYLNEVITLSSTMDLEYLHTVMNEALRYESPA